MIWMMVNMKKSLKKELPNLHNVQNPISKMELIKDIQEFSYQEQQQEWGEFNRTRGEELRRLEKTIIFNQLVKNILHILGSRSTKM